MSFVPTPLPDLLPSSLIERFWSKVDIKLPDECWRWLGFCDKAVYGYFRIGRFVYKAHRVSYHLEVDQSNPLQVMHKCDNPPCCNFMHLAGGSPADNMADMVSKGRSHGPIGDSNILRINPPVGELHPLARLTWDKVREIRHRVSSGEPMGKSLASEYGIVYRHLYSIVRGKSWKE
jgi:hypothetical protein